MKKSIGLTKDVGYQFGLRKTFSKSIESTWDFMFSKPGLTIWLGELENDLELNKDFKTLDDVIGFVRILKPLSHIRMGWKLKDWKNMSTLQVRIFGDQHKTTISFHQEKLLDAGQRDDMKIYWNKKMSELTTFLSGA
jgi:activator of HSP90 ATPase